MDMHGFTLVSDISDDHIRGQYEGGMRSPPGDTRVVVVEVGVLKLPWLC